MQVTGEQPTPSPSVGTPTTSEGTSVIWELTFTMLDAPEILGGVSPDPSYP